MGNTAPDRRQLPARVSLLPGVALSIAALRSTVGATADIAGRTLRACAAIDPAALVTTIAAVPSLAEGVVGLVARLTLVTQRVEALLDGVERTHERVDSVVERADAVLGQVDGVARLADGAVGRVEEVVGRVDGVVDRADQVMGRVDEVTAGVDGVVGRADGVLGRVGEVTTTAGSAVADVQGVVADASSVVGSATTAISEVRGAVRDGNAAIAAANETVQAAQPSVRQLAEITEALHRLEPLLDGLKDVDPAVGRDAATVVRALPPLLQRVDERVLPAVAALESLVPVVHTLHDNVNQLQTVVNDVGTLLSGLPGASRLLKRGGREVRSPDNNTSIMPPA
jgi:ABC-type transporter Mla subunit MlaD